MKNTTAIIAICFGSNQRNILKNRLNSKRKMTFASVKESYCRLNGTMKQSICRILKQCRKKYIFFRKKVQGSISATSKNVWKKRRLQREICRMPSVKKMPKNSVSKKMPKVSAKVTLTEKRKPISSAVSKVNLKAV